MARLPLQRERRRCGLLGCPERDQAIGPVGERAHDRPCGADAVRAFIASGGWPVWPDAARACHGRRRVRRSGPVVLACAEPPLPHAVLGTTPRCRCAIGRPRQSCSRRHAAVQCSLTAGVWTSRGLRGARPRGRRRLRDGPPRRPSGSGPSRRRASIVRELPERAADCLGGRCVHAARARLCTPQIGVKTFARH